MTADAERFDYSLAYHTLRPTAQAYVLYREMPIRQEYKGQTNKVCPTIPDNSNITLRCDMQVESSKSFNQCH